MQARDLWVALICLSLTACGGGGSAPPATTPPDNPPPPPPPPPPPDPDPDPDPGPGAGTGPFHDVTDASGISFQAGFTWPPTTAPDTQIQAGSSTGGGAAGDCDGDGDIDLFITYGDFGDNRLYMNQLQTGSGAGTPMTFIDMAEAAGVGKTRPPDDPPPGNNRHSGPVFADLDGDRDLDLFIGGQFGDSSKIYRNNGSCVFEDVTAGSGIEDGNMPSASTLSAAFGDFDLDGDLDLFATHWGSPLDPVVDTASDYIFRNVSTLAEIRFENVTAATGVDLLIRDGRAFLNDDFGDFNFDQTFTASIARINDDLWPDIAIASDFGTAQLLVSDPANRGRFVDASNDAVHTVQNAMGSTLGDFDFDGDLDWFVTSIYERNLQSTVLLVGNRLYRNPGGNLIAPAVQLEDVTVAAGVDQGGWGWAACFLDIDNDTDLDIYHTNGWPLETQTVDYSTDASRVFVSDASSKSDGEPIVFTEDAEGLSLHDGFDGRGAVCADFDNDGDIDILQLTTDAENSAALWENREAAVGNAFMRVQLYGLPPNTEAAGARVFATIGERRQMREIIVGNNYISQNPNVQIFGLGDVAAVDELLVEWPALWSGSAAEQPAASEFLNVTSTLAGETLLICHPDLAPADRPAECLDEP